MSTTLRVNRCLADEAMEAIDHALGRPLDPLVETHRNYFAAPPVLAAQFAATPHWDVGSPMPGGIVSCRVTEEGRRALAAYLLQAGDPHRAFEVLYDSHTTTVVATTPGRAKYSYFLDLRDSFSELTFAEFCRKVSVRSIPLGRKPA
ncbi:hypothetical protein [Rhodoplanes roseus]|uniref:Uncharacterized protein n=1 Tax=Rhodoplanes roseus TaxID=29409 RepID=A0A327L2F4_9BRAD|nr:hypothetical protein [Rhodoplanes roseus]RAI45270.1 hypothetical protein CH341_04980 [Rhodoplanes roseus]